MDKKKKDMIYSIIFIILLIISGGLYYYFVIIPCENEEDETYDYNTFSCISNILPEATPVSTLTPIPTETQVATTPSPLTDSDARYRDRDEVLTAVTQDGNALKNASPELRADKDVVLAAVTQNGNALEYASEALRDNGAVVFEALLQSKDALTFASQKLQYVYNFQIDKGLNKIVDGIINSSLLDLNGNLIVVNKTIPIDFIPSLIKIFFIVQFDFISITDKNLQLKLFDGTYAVTFGANQEKAETYMDLTSNRKAIETFYNDTYRKKITDINEYLDTNGYDKELNNLISKEHLLFIIQILYTAKTMATIQNITKTNSKRFFFSSNPITFFPNKNKLARTIVREYNEDILFNKSEDEYDSIVNKIIDDDFYELQSDNIITPDNKIKKSFIHSILYKMFFILLKDIRNSGMNNSPGKLFGHNNISDSDFTQTYKDRILATETYLKMEELENTPVLGKSDLKEIIKILYTLTIRRELKEMGLWVPDFKRRGMLLSSDVTKNKIINELINDYIDNLRIEKKREEEAAQLVLDNQERQARYQIKTQALINGEKPSDKDLDPLLLSKYEQEDLTLPSNFTAPFSKDGNINCTNQTYNSHCHGSPSHYKNITGPKTDHPNFPCPKYSRHARTAPYSARVYDGSEQITCDYSKKDIKLYDNYIAINLSRKAASGSSNDTTMDFHCNNAAGKEYPNLVRGNCAYIKPNPGIRGPGICKCSQATPLQNQTITTRAMFDSNPLYNNCTDNSNKTLFANQYVDTQFAANPTVLSNFQNDANAISTKDNPGTTHVRISTEVKDWNTDQLCKKWNTRIKWPKEYGDFYQKLSYRQNNVDPVTEKKYDFTIEADRKSYLNYNSLCNTTSTQYTKQSSYDKLITKECSKLCNLPNIITELPPASNMSPKAADIGKWPINRNCAMFSGTVTEPKSKTDCSSTPPLECNNKLTLECELYPEYPTSITEWTGDGKPNSNEEEYPIAGAKENVAFLENNCKEGKKYTGHLNYIAKENNDNTIYRSSYMNLRSNYK